MKKKFEGSWTHTVMFLVFGSFMGYCGWALTGKWEGSAITMLAYSLVLGIKAELMDMHSKMKRKPDPLDKLSAKDREAAEEIVKIWMDHRR